MARVVWFPRRRTGHELRGVVHAKLNNSEHAMAAPGCRRFQWRHRVRHPARGSVGNVRGRAPRALGHVATARLRSVYRHGRRRRAIALGRSRSDPKDHDLRYQARFKFFCFGAPYRPPVKKRRIARRGRWPLNREMKNVHQTNKQWHVANLRASRQKPRRPYYIDHKATL